MLAGAGAQWLGVTGAEEGAAARSVCPQQRILLMSGIFPGEAETVIDQGLTPVVWEPWQLDLLERAAAAAGTAGREPSRFTWRSTPHVAPGGARHGDESRRKRRRCCAAFIPDSCFRLEGVSTYFCAPETMSSHRPNPQLANLAAAIEFIVGRRGCGRNGCMSGNSSSIIAGPDRQAAIVDGIEARDASDVAARPCLSMAISTVSRWTVSHGMAKIQDFEAALAWKTQVTSLRSLRRGETAGYGHTFTAGRETRIALLPVGYADGLNRLLSNRGHVLVRGQEAPIAGRISMGSDHGRFNWDSWGRDRR